MNIFLIIILLFIVIEYILNFVSRHLNIKNLETELPEEFKNYYDEEDYKKSQLYTKEKTKFSNVNDTVMVVFKISFILLGGFNLIDNWARDLVSHPVLTGVIFLWILILLLQVISIPFSYYGSFVIEEKYGFNRMNLKTFFTDNIKTLLLTLILSGAMFAPLIWLFSKMDSYAWVMSWIFVFILTLVIQYLAPVLIMPLFNKFYPLEDEELKNRIMNYADNYAFNIEGIFTMDGSKRTTKANAYFTGIGKNKRIVFYDNLVENFNNNEIMTILAHEMGHYKLKHILKRLLVSFFTTGVMFYLLSLFIKNEMLFEAFKMDNLSIYAGIVFFGLLYSPINMLLSLINKYVSRKNEKEADEFAARTTGNPNAFIKALKKLSLNNLTNLTPHPATVFLKYSHPPVLERIKNIKNYMNAKSNRDFNLEV
ncbi:MAG: M48 family metallopeptidase [Candidatus Mcinerneyibacterium aminivorans]|uniref:M48 family metallopeptidase n=1 Tax=Candidatus Mcinerneyibacterium aminivorans TaxID=2703815 RepID=A0A5D0ME15_9BACT|nr:MAG: M48 family metallopeptidase [Candidatus Mcinerneyibacterium aminivorans]